MSRSRTFWGRLARELNQWLDDHGHATARELTGLYLKNLEGAGPSPMEGPPPVVDEEKCTLCGVCVTSCEYDALRIDKDENPEAVIVDGEKCYVCGLCVTVCPTGALAIELDPERGPAGPIRP